MADWDPRANAIFLNALKHQGDRQAYLQVACGDDAALRRAVEALLAAHDQAGSFLDQPAVPPLKPAEPASHADTDTEVLALLGATTEPGSLGRLDHYEVLEVAGRGAMGVVFKARDTKLQRVVAVKMLAPRLAVDGTARKRFVREAQAAAAIRDDHVVGIHAVHDDPPIPYLVMEFISGTTLAERIDREGPLELKEILRIGLQMAEGLAAAHKQGLVHRDIKPANILLENDVQRVKITDFGLARAVQHPGWTEPGGLAGTPLYMSPEQARGEEVTTLSDLFSLGSVLYMCCTGRDAFMADTALAVRQRVREVQPPPIRAVNPEMPDYLTAVVDKLLAKDPAQRYQSAAEVAEVLRKLLAQLQQQHFPNPVTVDPVKGQVVSRRRPLAIAVALLALLALAGAAAAVAVLTSGWWLSGPSEQVKPTDTAKPPPRKDTLTVSQNPEHQADYSKISAALDNIQSGMTIRILDDSVYEEQLHFNHPDRHRGVTLEAAKGKKPTLKMTKDKYAPFLFCVNINGVEGFTLRGLIITDAGIAADLIVIDGPCPGLVLTDLDLQSSVPNGSCVSVAKKTSAGADAPMVMQHCTVRGATLGFVVQGRVLDKWDIPAICDRIILRNNTFDRCVDAIKLFGAFQHIHIVGNTFVESRSASIQVTDVLPGTAGVVIVNNTFFRNAVTLAIWDDDANKISKNVAVQCQNMRFQNNLVLNPVLQEDLVFVVHERANWKSEMRPGDVQALVKVWQFSNNWREIDGSVHPGWIPGSRDTLRKPLDFMYPKKGLEFPPPPRDSDLATGGVGDGVLPAYVGAVPPVGVPAWDWDKTWKALQPK
jgi:serine/threonine protein kinase